MSVCVALYFVQCVLSVKCCFVNPHMLNCVCAWVCYLSHKDAVLLRRAGLVPDGELQHVVAEIPAVDVSVDEGLVPLGLAGLLHCFRSAFALVAALNSPHSTRSARRCLLPLGIA